MKLRISWHGWLADVGTAYLLHQLLFLIVSIVALNVIPPYSGGGYPTWHTPANSLIDASWRWDGQWYWSIITSGYSSAGESYSNAAFFPLFPFLVYLLSAPWGQSAVPLAGAVIPRIAFAAALLYIYQLAKLEHSTEVAARTVLYLAIYPTALFFSAAYPESLLLLLSAAAMYYSRRQRFWLAGLCGALAALTRLQGIVLVIPLAYELWQSKPRRRLDWISLLLVPAGLTLFTAYLWWTVGDGLAFFHAQRAWLRTFNMPYDTIFDAIRMAMEGEPDAWRRAMGIINTSALLTFVVVALLGVGKQRLSYGLYSLACLALPLFSPVPDMPTVSVARFTAVIFPVFFLIGRWGGHPRSHSSVLLASGVLFALLTALFVNWYWVV